MNEFDRRERTAASLVHGYGFDPRHGYRLEDLLQLKAPAEPADFVDFWQEKYTNVISLPPLTTWIDTGKVEGAWKVYDWCYLSTDNEEIRGWGLWPVSGVVKRGVLIGHGYAGRFFPDFEMKMPEAALFFPCLRGLGRSRSPNIPGDVAQHTVHQIQSRQDYVLGGCAEDLWLGVTSILHLFPQLQGHLGYMGISFGGGIGALALPWEERIQRLHLNVPTFGNTPLRLKLASTGSAAALQKYVEKNPEVIALLPYFDAAIAARHLRKPVHCACALFDPSVAPAGQFSIFNSFAGPKQLYLLTAGHHSYPTQSEENRELWQEIYNFFADI